MHCWLRAAWPCLSKFEGEAWTITYTDGSVKQVGGGWQAGYGNWFGRVSERNYAEPVLVPERQSVSSAGLGERDAGGGAFGGGFGL